jgi:hypothetical protein
VPLVPEDPEVPLVPELPLVPEDPDNPEVPLNPLYTHEIVYVSLSAKVPEPTT